MPNRWLLSFPLQMDLGWLRKTFRFMEQVVHSINTLLILCATRANRICLIIPVFKRFILRLDLCIYRLNLWLKKNLERQSSFCRIWRRNREKNKETDMLWPLLMCMVQFFRAVFVKVGSKGWQKAWRSQSKKVFLIGKIFHHCVNRSLNSCTLGQISKAKDYRGMLRGSQIVRCISLNQGVYS